MSLITSRLNPQTTLLIETPNNHSNINTHSEILPTGLKEKIFEKVNQSFDGCIETIVSLGRRFADAMEGIGENKPNEFEVSLGLSISAEGDTYLVKVAGEGQINLTLKWRKDA